MAKFEAKGKVKFRPKASGDRSNKNVQNCRNRLFNENLRIILNNDIP